MYEDIWFLFQNYLKRVTFQNLCLLLMPKIVDQYQRFIFIRSKQMDNTADSPQMTLEMIKNGNLALNERRECGIFMVGNTKAGKTTSAHYLVGSSLIGIAATPNPKLKVHQCLPEHSSAAVGLQQASQTQIPNQFRLNGFQGLQNPNTILYDCPGYSDEYGCSRVISNGFFHYRLFSKVTQVKFIFTFTFNDLAGTAILLTDAFNSFVSGFANFSDIEADIIAATSFLVTAVPANMDFDAVLTALTNVELSKKKKYMREVFMKFKKEVIAKKRMIIIKQAQVGAVVNGSNTEIIRIDKLSKFWTRKLTNQEVDMAHINTNIRNVLIDEYTNDTQFKEEFQKFGRYYETVFSNKMNDLSSVMSKLVSDAFENPDSQKPTFVNLIADKNKLEEGELEKKRKAKDPIYEVVKQFEDRKVRAINQLYSANALNSDSHPSVSRNTPFWLKRIRIAELLNNFCEEYGEQGNANRRVQDVLKMTLELEKRIGNIVGLAKNADELKLFKRFCFNVHEWLEISNVFYRIVYEDGSDKQKAVLANDHPLNIIIVKFPLKLVELSQTIFLDSIDNLKLKSVNKINLASSLDKETNKEVVEYLKELKSLSMAQGKGSAEIFSDISLKAHEMILSQAEEDLRRNPDRDTTRDIIRNLLILREDIENEMSENRLSAFESEPLTFQSVRMLNILASCLVHIEKEDIAIKIWEIIVSPHQIFQTLDNLQTKKQAIWKKEQGEHLKHLLHYMDLSRKYGRYELSMQKSHEAIVICHRLKQLSKLNQVRNHMSLLVKPEIEPNSQFTKWLKGGIYEMKLPNDIVKRISDILK